MLWKPPGDRIPLRDSVGGGRRRATQILLFECSASSERNRGGGGKQPIDLLTHEVDNFTVFKAKSNEICCF